MELNPHSPPADVKCDLVQIHRLRHPGQICLLNPSILPIKQSPFPQDLPALSPSKGSLLGAALSFLPHSVNFFTRNNFRSKRKRDATTVKDEILNAEQSGKFRVKVPTAIWALPSHALQQGAFGAIITGHWASPAPAQQSVQPEKSELLGPREGRAAVGNTRASP